MNVYVQNYRLVAPAPGYESMPLLAAGGVDFPTVFQGLRSTGYDGYVTVHTAAGGVMAPSVAAIKGYEFLKPLISDRRGIVRPRGGEERIAGGVCDRVFEIA